MNNMKSVSVLDIINQIANEPSKNAKIELLEKYKTRTDLRSVLNATYNPFLTYGIKKIPDYQPQTCIDGASLYGVINNFLPLLVSRKVTGNNAKTKLMLSLESLNPGDAEILARIIKKDIKGGFSATTINKVWPGLIPQHCYMGAIAYNEQKFNKFPWAKGVVSQIKENGMFTSYDMFGSSDPIPHTRLGKTLDFKGLFTNWIKAAGEIMKVSYPEMFKAGRRFDGEILVIKDGVDPLGFDYEERSIGNGIANKAEYGTLSIEEAKRLRYVVWDFVDINDAYAGVSNEPYDKRFKTMVDIVNRTNAKVNFNLVRPVETRVVHSPEESQEHFRIAVRRGLEGTIVKHTDHVWKDGKPSTQMKLKVFAECEFKIVAYNESEKVPGTLASFSCESSCGKLKADFGSGYSKKQREEFLANGESMIGSIITGQFCELSSNSKGGLSVSNPVFVEVRGDKFVANSYEEIVVEYEAKTGCKAAIKGGK